MIAMLEGVVAAHEKESVILMVGGVGYRVFVTRLAHEVGDRARYFISEVIREDRHDLFGFASQDEQLFFEQITNVQGVGPKMGQKIMSAGSLDAVVRHIQAGDLAFLTSISGVGKKTAQKIILDMKGVLVGDGNGERGVRDDVMEALLSLGYSKPDIAEIAPHVVGDTTEERIKSALKMLAR